MAKMKDSRYISRRTNEWLKIINYQYAEVYITGYRNEEFGWLVHVMEKGRLWPAGIFRSAASSEAAGKNRGYYNELGLK
ncbi:MULTISPECIES: hypothetical protein [unclassified Paenibacillus]|uniref:hypothetical protein n=1 Tax=unclassified Paenibacillus TaxID=185978 RepID=UPI001AE35427|nr:MULTISPECIES: hypothetical protein [unclassified Paenibacillus]MBP1155705.1 hypothetical protein [Paenibacillus sp. PvP091]MBP1168909.1 hypothetical protein [Paenibacillus sp. PvR098]MBP2439937.1 hypothetical protein [Paenibacillus sp. PvP052]